MWFVCYILMNSLDKIFEIFISTVPMPFPEKLLTVFVDGVWFDVGIGNGTRDVHSFFRIITG